MKGGLVKVDFPAEATPWPGSLAVCLSLRPFITDNNQRRHFSHCIPPPPRRTPPELSITSTPAAFLRGPVPTCGEGRTAEHRAELSWAELTYMADQSAATVTYLTAPPPPEPGRRLEQV